MINTTNEYKLTCPVNPDASFNPGMAVIMAEASSVFFSFVG